MKRAATVRGEVTHPAGRRPRSTLLVVTHPNREEKIVSTGIRKLHSKGCTGRDHGRCSCGAGWEVSVFSKRDGKKIRKTFPTKAEAKTWRVDAAAQLAKGGLRAPKPTTIQQAWEEWYEGAKEGTIRNRSGDPFKPSALRSYEGAMRREILPQLGSVRLSELRRGDLQEFADNLLARGLSPSAVQVTLLPLRALYRRAIARDELAINPCTGLHLPAVRGGRERYATPEEAESLIAAVPEQDRATWATAMYGGLRLGELRALRVEDVDLADGVISVERGWDPAAGPIELKSRAGRRKVPIAAILRDYLAEHLAYARIRGSDLVFGNTPEIPFTANMLQRRADQAWAEAGLERITPHACRHTFASLMIAAGVNAKALSQFMGHAKIGITLDRYGHLMPGSEEEAAGMLDAYLEAQREAAEERARAAAPASG
jgi:integrase